MADQIVTTAPVLVTGATGFIASHLVQQLLAKGYRVRGTARSTDPAKVSHLTSLPNASTHLELVVADLLGENAFDSAVIGCEYIMHTASPYVLNVEDPERDLVKPAVEGTLSVLRSCQKTTGIKRVIITSSMAAITDEPITGHVYTEADWNETSSLTRNPYYYSKTLAERASWKFVEEQKPAFSVVTINPYVVLGPAHTSAVNTSTQIFVDLANGKFPGIINLNWTCVDVRDVAKSHVLAMEQENANGRYICISAGMSMKDVVSKLREKGFNYPKFPTMNLVGGVGDSLTKMFSYFQPKGTGQFIRTNLGRSANCDNSKIKRELGMEFIPLETTLVDTMHDLIKWKHIPPPPSG